MQSISSRPEIFQRAASGDLVICSSLGAPPPPGKCAPNLSTNCQSLSPTSCGLYAPGQPRPDTGSTVPAFASTTNHGSPGRPAGTFGSGASKCQPCAIWAYGWHFAQVMSGEYGTAFLSAGSIALPAWS